MNLGVPNDISFDNLIKEHLIEFKSNNKKIEIGDDIPELHGVFYTDGGSVNGATIFGGWGIHGYLYHDSETKSNSNCKRGAPYSNGYNAKNGMKVPVVSYLDYYGSEFESCTNNKAELIALIECLSLCTVLPIKSVKILADSQYVIKLMEGRDKYRENGYKAASGNDIANKELAIIAFDLLDRVTTTLPVDISWVAGHSGDVGNDIADKLATKGLNHVRNTVNNIKFVREIPNNRFLEIKPPSQYFGSDLLVPKLLTETNLFFSTNGIDERQNNVYYQASFGSGLSSKKQDEKKQLRGKPFSDMCMSVIMLNEPDELTNKLINIVSSNMDDTGVVECNLSYQTRNSVYNELSNGGLVTSFVDKSRNKIITSDKVELAGLINPARQSFRMIHDFNYINAFLLDFKAGFTTNMVTLDDITDKIFDIETNKKGVVSHKAKPLDDGLVSVDIKVPDESGNAKTVNIPLTIGVDLPKRNALVRFKDSNPIVKLFTWDKTLRTLRYGVLIESDEGIGVWMSIYSNTVLL